MLGWQTLGEEFMIQGEVFRVKAGEVVVDLGREEGEVEALTSRLGEETCKLMLSDRVIGRGETVNALFTENLERPILTL